MVVYSTKDLMGLCSDYALDAEIQKILFSLDLWVPKAAREVQIDNVAQRRHVTVGFSDFNRARSPEKNDNAINSNNRLRRTFGLRSMSAGVFHSSSDSNSSGSSRLINISDSRESTKSSSMSLIKKTSNGQNLDDNLSSGQSQGKLMPILEGGEIEEKVAETSVKNKTTALPSIIINTTTTLDWTPTETDSAAGRSAIDALFELSVRADSALKTALCENNATETTNTNNNDRLTLRKSVSVMNQKQKVGSGRSLIRAKSDMVNSEANRKRALSHIVRTSERYFNDDPKVIAEIEELEVEYLFNYIRHLKTFPKYTSMTEDEILRDVESDPHTLRQRTKEILKGKMSESYAAYLAKYPTKKQRRKEHPITPNKYRKCSRRCFDGQLRTWRRNLHQFDDENKQDTAGTFEVEEQTSTELIDDSTE